MTTPLSETKSQYIRRMSDDGVGGLASPAVIEAAIADSFDDIANVVTDVGDLPSTATIRPAGSFTDAESARQYLETGGLLTSDGAGNTEPLSFVWVLEEFDDILNQTVWTVYIDQETG